MADKESETDRWISHFRSMAEGTGDKEQKKFLRPRTEIKSSITINKSQYNKV